MNMIKDEIENIVIKFLDGSISQAEENQLLEWMKGDESRLQDFIEHQEIWKASSCVYSEKSDKEVAFRKIHEKIDIYNNRYQFMRTAFKYSLHIAATILFVISLAILFQHRISHQKINSYTNNYYTEISTSGGNRSKITLPDGTKVWINANTTLRYPSVFESDKREVFVDGEIFLDVAKDSSRPFYVETSSLKLEVLGTSFNVNSYSDENVEQLTLVEGSLKIVPKGTISGNENSLTIKPNETALFKKEQRVIAVHELESNTGNKEVEFDQNQVVLKRDISDIPVSELESIISWKEDRLIFKNETLEEMCNKMERWYGIKILIKDESIKNNRYTGKFIYNESIDQVMYILQRTTQLNFTLEKDELTIFSKS